MHSNSTVLFTVLGGISLEIRGIESKIPFISDKLNLPRQWTQRCQPDLNFHIQLLCILSSIILVQGTILLFFIYVYYLHIGKTVNFVLQHSIFLKFFAALLEIFSPIRKYWEFLSRAVPWRE